MKFILICATGRSGSTTLQRIINTIPNSIITGEKMGAIENLLECYNNLKKSINCIPNLNGKFLTSNEMKEENIKPAWYNCYDLEEVKTNIKNTIISILVNKKLIYDENIKVLGYKEIRWFDKLHLLDDFLELFPNTKIICHIHDNIDKQIHSGWWDDTSKLHLFQYNEQLIKYSLNNKNCILTYMSDLFIISKIQHLFLFLDELFNEEEYNFIINNNLG